MKGFYKVTFTTSIPKEWASSPAEAYILAIKDMHDDLENLPEIVIHDEDTDRSYTYEKLGPGRRVS